MGVAAPIINQDKILIKNLLTNDLLCAILFARLRLAGTLENKMNNKELIALYVEAYQTGSSDLRSVNKWLVELGTGVKLIAKNGIVIKIVEL